MTVKMREREPRQIVSASVPAALAQQLERLAREQDRSLSGEIRRALIEHLRASGDRQS